MAANWVWHLSWVNLIKYCHVLFWSSQAFDIGSGCEVITGSLYTTVRLCQWLLKGLNAVQRLIRCYGKRQINVSIFLRLTLLRLSFCGTEVTCADGHRVKRLTWSISHRLFPHTDHRVEVPARGSSAGDLELLGNASEALSLLLNVSWYLT